MYKPCKKCNKIFDAGETYRGGPKTTCEMCKKNRIKEFQYRYHFSRRKNHIPRTSKLRCDIISGVIINDFTHYGYKSTHVFSSTKSRLRSEGLNIPLLRIKHNG